MRGICAFVSVISIAIVGCTNRSTYNCSGSEQCVLNGASGTCEPEGFCSFPDPVCPSGNRYESNAGGDLAGECTTPPPVPDAPPPPCGAPGQVCCAGEPACVAGASCTAGTCTECVTEIGLGHRFACYLERDQTVWCAGENFLGQLGSGMTSTMPTPVAVQVRDAAGPIADATAVGSGYNHACVVRLGGTVSCWGQGTSGQLGNNLTMNQPLAVRVVKAGGVPLDKIVQLTLGMRHSCGRDSNGDVWCWGDNGSNQLGDGTTTARPIAAPVLIAAAGQPFTGAIELASGRDHTCARKANDQVSCWGANFNGQFGDGARLAKPVPVVVATTKSFSPGMRHSCWVNSDSTVSCAGANWHGQIGIGIGGSFIGNDELMPKTVITELGGGMFTGAVEVVAGAAMTCARMTTGKVFCWGDNNAGQVGAGASNPVPSEVLVRRDGRLEPLEHVDRLIGRFPHACAHTTDQGWLCWGRNRDGELADGTLTNRGFAKPLGLTCP